MTDTKVIKVPTNDAAAARVLGETQKRPKLGDVFKQILLKKGIDENALKELIMNSVRKDNPDELPANQERTVEHIHEYLLDPGLAWVKFCKGLEILGVDEITILV